MSVEVTLIVLSSLVIFSYLFDLIAKQFKIPSVILLLLSGIGLRYLASWLELPIPNFEPILPLVGTIGLILIVLEGALELKLEREKSALIKSSLASASSPIRLSAVARPLFMCPTPTRVCRWPVPSATA